MRDSITIEGREVVFDSSASSMITPRKWRLVDGYACSGAVAMHRLVLPDASDDQVVDHINGNTLDNRRSNLRACTHLENARNRRKKSTTQNRFKGITKYYGTTWQAQITVKGVGICLGTFETDVDAARAYDSAANHIYGAFARLNFPDDKPLPFSPQSLSGLNRARMVIAIKEAR